MSRARSLHSILDTRWSLAPRPSESSPAIPLRRADGDLRPPPAPAVSSVAKRYGAKAGSYSVISWYLASSSKTPRGELLRHIDQPVRTVLTIQSKARQDSGIARNSGAPGQIYKSSPPSPPFPILSTPSAHSLPSPSLPSSFHPSLLLHVFPFPPLPRTARVEQFTGSYYKTHHQLRTV